jgi:hypothetical protein
MTEKVDRRYRAGNASFDHDEQEGTEQGDRKAPMFLNGGGHRMRDKTG